MTRRLSSSNKIKANREGSLSRLRGLDGMYIAPRSADDLISAPTLLSSAALPAPVSLAPTANLSDYDLPKGYISSSIAAEVVEVYRRGGRLSRESVHKVLRLGYRSLKALSNTTRMTVGRDDRLTVVGDIHGQLPVPAAQHHACIVSLSDIPWPPACQDLLHILDESKLPSRNNKYIFNGDFVDRGPSGVEVVCILMALYAAWPASVVLNRGNHEDYAICCVYGFQKECIDK